MLYSNMEVTSDVAMGSFGGVVERNCPAGSGLGKNERREIANNIDKSFEGFCCKGGQRVGASTSRRNRAVGVPGLGLSLSCFGLGFP